MSLFKNNAGTLAPRVDFTSGGSDHSAAVAGDLNGDGRADLVTLQGEDRYAVWLRQADGSYTISDFALGSRADRLALADLDADGDLDLVASNRYSYFGSYGYYGEPASDLLVVLGNGNGTFGAPAGRVTGTISGAAVLGDLDGDGRLDLITANQSANPQSSLTLWLGQPGGQFAVQSDLALGFVPGAIALRDLNADGRLDLVALNSDPELGRAAVLLGQGGGSFGAATLLTTGLGPRSLALEDVDADGDIDLLTGNGDATFSLFKNTATGFLPRVDVAVAGAVEQLSLGDLDKDGDLDAVALSFTSTGDRIASAAPGRPQRHLPLQRTHRLPPRTRHPFNQPRRRR